MSLPESMHGFPVSDFVASPQGMHVLDTNQELRSALGAFCATPVEAETAFDGYHRIGGGNHSDLWTVSNVAVKVSTLTTGGWARTYNQKIRPEDLTRQHTFMSALGVHLEEIDDDIQVPDQLFGLHAANGGYVLGQEYLDGWTEMSEWLKAQQLAPSDAAEILDHSENRLIAAVGSSSLKVGLTDLRLDGSFGGRNVMVPEDSDPRAEMPMCIIDQPGTGLKAWLGHRAAKKLLAR